MKIINSRAFYSDFSVNSDAESVTEFPVSCMTSKELTVTETSYRKDEASVTPSTSLAFVAAMEQRKKKSYVLTDVDSFNSLESMVRIKEAESRMFQKKADEARREAESFKREDREDGGGIHREAIAVVFAGDRRATEEEIGGA